MKQSIKNIALSLVAILFIVSGATSCEALLDMQPISSITPEGYYKTADQLAAYLTYYYGTFLSSPSANGNYYHSSSYSNGMNASDAYTDIYLSGFTGSTTYFADDHWQQSTSSFSLNSGYFSTIRVANYFLEIAQQRKEEGCFDSELELANNYIGEGYFFRALTYWKCLVRFGDFSILEEVLPDDQNVIGEASKRSPRNEVARFILEDLDRAADLLYSRDVFQGQRINRETALLLKSRVALFEATFEKYHQGTGRVPGDSEWPGASMDYNTGKTFDISSEIKFFLGEAMSAARQVADAITLTENNHTMAPELGTISGWNPYFEMFSQNDLYNVEEVLLWKQYDVSLGITHDVPVRSGPVANADGFTRAWAESFLMQSGLPIYADSNYKGDRFLEWVKAGRDERMQLFLWSEKTPLRVDTADPVVDNEIVLYGAPDMTTSDTEKRAITGYATRKYYTYDYTQMRDDALRGYNACPIFRAAEALLNYIEADYELNGSVSSISEGYWNTLRVRAGINGSIKTTIDNTDMSKEVATGNLGCYSGATVVDPTLYNIRRERMAETFNEGLRYTDLLRWRSWDPLIGEGDENKWLPEGVNLWNLDENGNPKDVGDEIDGIWRCIHSYYEYEYNEDTKQYEKLSDEDMPKADGTTDAVFSASSFSTYACPYSRYELNNELYKGYNWHKAYYLYPISLKDIMYGSPSTITDESYIYQNPYWPIEGGYALE